jgi:hypothetical protein
VVNRIGHHEKINNNLNFAVAYCFDGNFNFNGLRTSQPSHTQRNTALDKSDGSI